MYHFCGVDPLPAPPIDGARPADRITAWLWRRRDDPNLAALAGPMAERDRYNAHRHGAEEPTAVPRRGVQPASYFALELDERAAHRHRHRRHRGARRRAGRVAAADLRGREAEGAPDREAAAHRRPLPARADRWDTDRPEPGLTVDDIVRDPANHFVAAIGGDTHNYQRLPVRIGERTIQYIVAGAAARTWRRRIDPDGRAVRRASGARAADDRRR